MASLSSLRSALAAASRRLGALGFAPYHMGNLSLRLPGPAGRPRFLVTPTAVSKVDVKEDGLLVVDGAGKVLEGSRKPFSELSLHLACYLARTDVNAVVHAHPPTATACGAAGKTLPLGAQPEAVVALGAEVPLAPFAMPKAKEGEAAVKALAEKGDAVLVQGNGVFTLGADLEMAMLRMELVEQAAIVLRDAEHFGGARPLAGDEAAALLAARKKAGLGPLAPEAALAEAVAKAVQRKLGANAPADLVSKIVREELSKR
jgi:L-fuculose-phosphate aldolase